jgi:heat shock 70kDa protein 4
MQMLEDDVEVPVSSANEAPNDTMKMDTDDAPSDPAVASDVNMQEPKSADTAEAAHAAENGPQDTEEKSVPMETDAKV